MVDTTFSGPLDDHPAHADLAWWASAGLCPGSAERPWPSDQTAQVVIDAGDASGASLV